MSLSLTRSGWIIVEHPVTGAQHSRHVQEREAVESAAQLASTLGQAVTIRYDQTVRVSVSGGIADPVEPPPSGVRSGYRADPAFDGATLPERTLDFEGVKAWRTIWTSDMDGLSQSLQQVTSNPDAYQAGRRSGPEVHAMASLLWRTGDPAYLEHVDTAVENMLANMTMDDPWGGKMYDTSLVLGDGGPDPFETMQLEEGITYASFGTLVRILHENGRDVDLAVQRMRECWRRWQAGAWAWNEVPGSYDPLATTTHFKPNLTEKPFAHPMSGLAVLAWQLYKVTGNTNYRDGAQAIVDWFLGSLVETTGDIATWRHTPNSGKQGHTYVRYTGSHLATLAREGAFPVGTWAALRRGMAYDVSFDDTLDGYWASQMWAVTTAGEHVDALQQKRSGPTWDRSMGGPAGLMATA